MPNYHFSSQVAVHFSGEESLAMFSKSTRKHTLVLAVAFAFISSFSHLNLAAEAQAVNSTSFTQFELFKNTGLVLCNSNTTSNPIQSIAARDPKGGKGGGSKGSKGSSSSGGDSSSKAKANTFIKSVWVSKSGDYCNYMVGTGVSDPERSYPLRSSRV
jgi:hypothetical protein